MLSRLTVRVCRTATSTAAAARLSTLRGVNALNRAVGSTTLTAIPLAADFNQARARQLGWLRTLGFATGAAAFSTLFYSSLSADEAKPAALSPEKFIPLTLEAKEALNDNSNIYVFKAPSPVDLTVASFFLLKATIDGKEVIRPYTPVKIEAGQYLFFLIKSYPEGKLSKHLSDLQPGATLEFKGPMKKIEVKPNFKKEIGLVGGGSGITPLYQVIDYLLAHPEDKTKIKLIYANVAEKDIWLKEYFDRAARDKPDRFSVQYVLEKPPADWKGPTGYVQKDLLKSFLPAPSKDSMIMVCGPPPMMNHISGNKAPDYSQGEVTGLLKELGYDKDTVFKF